MSKESFPSPEKDASYPKFEEGPNRHVPEIDQPKPEQATEAPSGAFKVTVDEAERFERPGFQGFIQVPTERGLGFSALTIWVNGEHPRKRIVEGTRTYYVVEGNGTFTLDDEVHTVGEGDLFVIPEGGEYNYEGEMALFEMNIPSDLSVSGTVVDERLEK